MRPSASTRTQQKTSPRNPSSIATTLADRSGRRGGHENRSVGQLGEDLFDQPDRFRYLGDADQNPGVDITLLQRRDIEREIRIGRVAGQRRASVWRPEARPT